MASKTAPITRSLLLKIGLFLAVLVAGTALWQRQTPTRSNFDAAEALANSKTNNPENTSPQEIASGRENPETNESGNFIPQDGLASVPANRFFTTSGMDGLSPRDTLSVFSVSQKVFAYAALNAPGRETVGISWFDPDGQIILPSAYIDVGINTTDRGYRIFTYRVFREAGDYSVRIFNSSGTRIAAYSFTVEE